MDEMLGGRLHVTALISYWLAIHGINKGQNFRVGRHGSLSHSRSSSQCQCEKVEWIRFNRRKDEVRGLRETFGENSINPELNSNPFLNEKLAGSLENLNVLTWCEHRTLNKEENTWNVYTAQEPSESHMSWLMWLRQAFSASSQAAGWNAARMAEKNGEGGGETLLSPSPKLEEMTMIVSKSDVLLPLQDGLSATPESASQGAHSAHSSIRGLLWELGF